MDQGSKLFNNPKVVTLFQSYGYEVLPTGADSLFKNGPVEHAHWTVSQGIRSLLIGANLDIKFWPYAFLHVLCILNALPGAGQSESPIFQSTGKKDNFKHLQVFGCRVWVQPPIIRRR